MGCWPFTERPCRRTLCGRVLGAFGEGTFLFAWLRRAAAAGERPRRSKAGLSVSPKTAKLCAFA